jgi:hypothetical protein
MMISSNITPQRYGDAGALSRLGLAGKCRPLRERIHGRTASLCAPCWKAQAVAASLHCAIGGSWGMPVLARQTAEFRLGSGSAERGDLKRLRA